MIQFDGHIFQMMLKPRTRESLLGDSKTILVDTICLTSRTSRGALYCCFQRNATEDARKSNKYTSIEQTDMSKIPIGSMYGLFTY